MIATLDALRAAIGSDHTVVYEPTVDALLRRVARRLPEDLVDDIARLIRYARSNP